MSTEHQNNLQTYSTNLAYYQLGYDLILSTWKVFNKHYHFTNLTAYNFTDLVMNSFWAPEKSSNRHDQFTILPTWLWTHSEHLKSLHADTTRLPFYELGCELILSTRPVFKKTLLIYHVTNLVMNTFWAPEKSSHRHYQFTPTLPIYHFTNLVMKSFWAPEKSSRRHWRFTILPTW